MLIALDYDNTYTRDRPFWDSFVRNAAVAGHRVVCVTMRHESETSDMDIPAKIICTAHKAKRAYMQALGHSVDIWIDDTPDFILQDAKT